MTLSKCLGGRTASLAASVYRSHPVRDLNRLAWTAHATVVCRAFMWKEFRLLCNEMCVTVSKKSPMFLSPHDLVFVAKANISLCIANAWSKYALEYRFRESTVEWNFEIIIRHCSIILNSRQGFWNCPWTILYHLKYKLVEYSTYSLLISFILNNFNTF